MDFFIKINGVQVCRRQEMQAGRPPGVRLEQNIRCIQLTALNKSAALKADIVRLQKDIYQEPDDKQKGKCQMYEYCQFRTLFYQVRIIMVFIYNTCSPGKNKNVRD